jgi:hypothetical protein
MTKIWWWIERSREWLNGFSMYLVMVYFVKLLNVDHGLAREHPWIGNSRGGVVLGIHSVIAMHCWWQHLFLSNLEITSCFACMCVPRSVCLWDFVGCVSIQFISILCWCGVGYWDWVLCVFFVGFGEDICVEGSSLVCHIENNFK